MKFTLFTAVLFSVWMNAADGDDRPPTCCPTVSNTRIPAENIVSYTIQEPTTGWCAIRAIRFLTKKGIIICSDPESNWAKKVMKIVDGRTTTNPTACFTSTTIMIPTTTHETSGLKTETSESTTDDHPVCCLTVSNTRIPAENIVDYHIQEQTGVCSLRAVRFLTKKDRYICSDPDDRWAIRAMESVDRRRPIPQGLCVQAYFDMYKTMFGYGHPESCCSTTISTTISVKTPVALGPLLIRKRSHSKKRLRKYQSKT